MNKLTTPILAVSYVAMIVLLGLYAMGFFDNGEVMQVENQEYEVGSYWYSGGFQGGLFNNYGEIRFENGDSYSGGFKDGRFHGKGVYRQVGDGEKENFRFDGTFRAGQAVRGTFYFGDGSTLAYSRDSRVENEQD
jgi:hypothetical protein